MFKLLFGFLSGIVFSILVIILAAVGADAGFTNKKRSEERTKTSRPNTPPSK